MKFKTKEFTFEELRLARYEDSDLFEYIGDEEITDTGEDFNSYSRILKEITTGKFYAFNYTKPAGRCDYDEWDLDCKNYFDKRELVLHEVEQVEKVIQSWELIPEDAICEV